MIIFTFLQHLSNRKTEHNLASAKLVLVCSQKFLSTKNQLFDFAQYFSFWIIASKVFKKYSIL
jgi:hypothetical protein